MRSGTNKRRQWDFQRRMGIVKSIQPFTVTIASSGTSNTATITAVDTTRSVIFYNQFTTSSTSSTVRLYAPRVELTNATTVTANRDTAEASTVTVRGTVIEFQPWAVTSVQHGTATIAASASSGTATINSVDTSRSVVLRLGQTSSTTTTSPQVSFCALDLTNSTTVTATRSATSTAVVTAGYCVVEFAHGILSSRQQTTATQATTATTITATISAVDMSRAILIYQGVTCNTTSTDSWFYRLELTDPTTVTLTRNGTLTTTRTIYFTVLEFAPGILFNLQRGSTAVSGVGSASATINAINEENGMVLSTHLLTNTNTSGQRHSTVRILNDEALRIEKNTTTNSSTHGWEVFEWNMGRRQ